MPTLRALYHLARADFLERARRYSFLITVGLTIYIAYLYLPPSDATYLGFSLGDIRGIYNSAWIGSIIAVLCSTLLIVPGFYLVKNAITRDMDTRVGEILTTTPISKWGYAVGKMLSNFAYLSAMVAVIAVAGIIMQVIRGEDLRIDLWRYLAPLILSTLPTMLVVSALAVLFETIPWLRGGFGNIVYGVLWLTVLITTIEMSESTGRLRVTNDPTGITPIVVSMLDTAREKYPEVESGFAISVVAVEGPIRTFTWNGAQWTAGAVSGRLLWIGVAIGLVSAGAAVFNRFDPSTERRRREKAEPALKDRDAVISAPSSIRRQLHLTPLDRRGGNFVDLFWRTWLAELRLMFKGVRWWWYSVALGLMIAGFFSPLDVARQYVLPAAWIWPVLLWSPMGSREARHRMEQLVFSAAHPLQRQLPAVWCAGFTLAVFTSAGYAVRLMVGGQQPALFPWLVGAAFIPSLALALGVWSRSSKLFEVAYLLLWYIGPMSRLPALDYMGVTDGAVDGGAVWYFLVLSFPLIGLAMAGWRRAT